MALNVWTKPSGYAFLYSYVDNDPTSSTYGQTLTTPNFPERKQLDLALPVNGDAGVTYEVISGKLPPGLRIQGNHIVGTPFEVPRITTFLFCIRATKDTQFADRTFKLSIDGADEPDFITAEGQLSLSDAGQLYAMDSTFVDYQIEAFDRDTATGQKLNYFINRDEGELPPGLILTTDGRIVGFIQPVLSIKPEDGNGTYDDSYFDAVAYDFAFRPTNGYDSFVYDNVFYDLSVATRGPKKLNRNYEFIVSVSDGDSVAKRKFKIFVVGDDYFRADNAVWLDGSGLFTADVTYMRAPIWITAKDLGTYRANNYLTIPLETYDTFNTFYRLNPVNTEIRAVTKQATLADNIVGAITVARSTSASTNQIIVDNTFNIVPGMQVSFAGTGFGNIVRDKIYYIKEVTTTVPIGIAYVNQVGSVATVTTGVSVQTNTTASSVNTVTVSNTSGIEVGMEVVAVNVIPGTTVTHIDEITKIITLDQINMGNVTGVITFFKVVPHSLTSGVSIRVENTSCVDLLANITVTGATTFTYTMPYNAIISTTYVPNATATPSPQIKISETRNGTTLALSTATGLMDVHAGGRTLTITQCQSTPQYAQYLSLGAGTRIYQIYDVEQLGAEDYRLSLTDPLDAPVFDDVELYIGTISTLPPGMAFDVAASEIFGVVPYQPAITKTYTFSVIATRISDKGEEARSARDFTVKLVGEIDSVITWNTPSNLGTINANFGSLFSVSATSTIPDAHVLYHVTSGELPPGLALDLDGEIVGKVNQYYNATTGVLGLTTFNVDQVNNPTTSGKPTTFDGSTTSIDRVYSFTVEARDQYGYSATTRTFTITVETPNQLVYSNIRVQPFLKMEQRTTWKNFINDTSVFTPDSIYRPNDPGFGVQSDLRMLVYAGIETTDAAKYISAIGLNHKRKRFQFGTVKKATAYNPGTTTAIYEVIYVEMLDPLEPNNKRLPNSLQLRKQPELIKVDSSTSIWSRSINDLSNTAPANKRPDPIITIDSTGYQVSNPNATIYYPSSITNWRERLKYWSSNGETFANERNYLPLWMRSIQSGAREELGFQLAIPLCYCKVGTADDILLNIKFSNFDFRVLDYTADRYIIDAVQGETGDKYLVFKNDRITV